MVHILQMLSCAGPVRGTLFADGVQAPGGRLACSVKWGLLHFASNVCCAQVPAEARARI